ncbi:hypothetical protein [uncultured Microbacterium sp.]|uniref:hypothetical protein n=1 Tax=uncultured Microbacterium sp. TaxID=191216 RepID=UPI00262470D1|nr:hypothetical protein [uncultured Microbacterium sp.]
MSTRTPSPSIASARGRIGGLVRDRRADDPELIDARRDLAAEKIAAYIARVVAEAPPLTDTQRSRLAALLTAASPAPPRTVRRPVTVDEALADAPDHVALVSTPGGDDQ